MNQLIKNIKRLMLDILFPPICLSCRSNLTSDSEKSIFVCKNCLKKINIKKGKYEINEKFTLSSATSYKNKNVKNLIHNLKYRRITDAIIPIHKEIIKPYIKSVEKIFKNKNWVIVPVPLHKARERKRGFNQSLLISKKLKQELKRNNIKAEIAKNSLYKARNTKPQAQLKEKDRINNLKKSFSIQNKNSIKNKNIIIVDDVYTSGSTIKEILNTIKELGIENVIVFTIAKT